MPLERLLVWAQSPHGDLHSLAIELLSDAPGVEKLPLDTWLSLLGSTDPMLLAWLADAFVQHVAPDRLSLDQTVGLTDGPSAALALWAWTQLQDRTDDLDRWTSVLVSRQ